MNDLAYLVSTVLRIFLFWLSACLLAWAFIPGIKPVAAGLILGSSVSMINAQLLSAKVRKLSQLVVDNRFKRFSLGFVTRACIVLIAVMTAVKFAQFDLVSTIVGLLFFPAALFVGGIILVKRQ